MKTLALAFPLLLCSKSLFNLKLFSTCLRLLSINFIYSSVLRSFTLQKYQKWIYSAAGQHLKFVKAEAVVEEEADTLVRKTWLVRLCWGIVIAFTFGGKEMQGLQQFNFQGHHFFSLLLEFDQILFHVKTCCVKANQTGIVTVSTAPLPCLKSFHALAVCLKDTLTVADIEAGSSIRSSKRFVGGKPDTPVLFPTFSPTRW